MVHTIITTPFTFITMTETFASVQQAPSHIIADGSRVFLPPATSQEKAFFFARSVAKHNLVSVTSSSKEDTTSSTLEDSTEDKGIEKEKKKSEESEESAHVIHPLATASAKLESNGIAELSKAINLSTLVQTGEYFTFGNIVDSSLLATDKGDKSGIGTNPSSTSLSASSSAVVGGHVSTHMTPDQEEMKLRSHYILKRKRQQFENAKDSFYQHHKRLKVATVAQRVIDRRLLHLRNRWKIDVPEHPLIPVPIRPNEVVCIDVDVYQNHHEHSNGGHRGKIARKVPSYATIELSNDFDIMAELKRRKEEQKQLTMKEEEDHHQKEVTNPVQPILETSPNKDSVLHHETYKDNTRALPFQLADPTIGDVDLDFDPDNVPILRLVFEIEKSSTGFRHSVALNPNDTTSSNIEAKNEMDETVLQSLQHSLFCANIFDMIRNELDQKTFTKNETSVIAGSNVKTSQTQSTVPPAWLNVDMEENFLPPTSLMSSNLSKTSLFGNFITSPIAVIYCHDGEVKVQLNEEYSLIVKLEDTNKQVQASDNNEESTMPNDKDSGSQSKDELDILCRILLLHAQYVFHENKKLSELDIFMESRNNEANQISKVDYSVGVSKSTTKTKKKALNDSFPILQSCVALGLKILLDRRVKGILSVRWNLAFLYTLDSFHLCYSLFLISAFKGSTNKQVSRINLPCGVYETTNIICTFTNRSIFSEFPLPGHQYYWRTYPNFQLFRSWELSCRIF